MKRHELKDLGVPNESLDLAVELLTRAARAGNFTDRSPGTFFQSILDRPEAFIDDSLTRRFAESVIAAGKKIPLSKGPAPYQIWGEDQIDAGAIDQLRTACNLPVAVKAALMPDAHLGYGLPIGGVLATVGAVIPYAVGVDIGCRMKLTITDIPAHELQCKQKDFEKALLSQTRFGAGNAWDTPRHHDVMDADWSISPITREMKDKARGQLGTSGGGNHFVEFGTFQLLDSPPQSSVQSPQSFSLEPGKKYVALLSHSGSRGPGARVCQYYSDMAKKLLPKDFEWARHLAWLDLDTEPGQQYWNAMNLMGDFAKANHDVIHRQLIAKLGAQVLAQIENHHNFAWKETHDGQEMIVHRKGATPAGPGVLGVIPGSMADPAYVVRGRGVPASLSSAAHGAGRKLARSRAKATLKWADWHPYLKERGVKLLSAGLDEVPGAYKNIDQVMARQSDLVESLARFDPKIVRMADDGSAED